MNILQEIGELFRYNSSNPNGFNCNGGLAVMLLDTLRIVESKRVDPTIYLEEWGLP